MYIYALKIDGKINIEKYNELLSYITLEKRKLLERFRRWEDAHRSLIGEVLIRKIICEKCRTTNDKIKFYKNHYGKPFLNGVDDFYFNISHSGKWVVCIVDSKKVGIDIEEITPIDFAIADRFFLYEECKYIYEDLGKERLRKFYKLWTAKESYIKAVGKGLSIPLKSFRICFDGDNMFLKLEGSKEKYHYKEYFVDNEYCLTVCSLSDDYPSSVKILELDDILLDLGQVKSDC